MVTFRSLTPVFFAQLIHCVAQRSLVVVPPVQAIQEVWAVLFVYDPFTHGTHVSPDSYVPASHAFQFAINVLFPVVPVGMVTDKRGLFPYDQVHPWKTYPALIGLFNVKDTVSIVYPVLLRGETVQWLSV